MTDRYSKILLTIIALGVTAIAIENSGLLSGGAAGLVTPAFAQGSNNVMRVQICDFNYSTGSGQWNCAGVGGDRLLRVRPVQ